MSMLHDDEDYLEVKKAKTGIVMGCILATSAVILVLLVTFMLNKKPDNKQTGTASNVKQETMEANAELSELEDGKKKTSNELSFWHMYDENKPSNTVVPDLSGVAGDDKVKEKFVPEEKPALSDNSVSENALNSQEKMRQDGVSVNRFDVNELSDGKAELTGIISGIPVNNRFDDAFEDNGIWKDYALNGRRSSFRGIDVSSYQKDIDWEKAASSGVDFAMIRAGSRGYGSGRVVPDEKCADYMRGCSENGIKIGLYFESQAVNIMEAMEEANSCLAVINGQNIEYPIVFKSEAVTNDSYRTENLSKEELSLIAKAFCDTIKAYGYTPMIGGNKRRLALDMDPHIISDYDLWLYDTDEISVFPYRFNMWRYSVTGEVDGIEDPADLNISFTDYSVK